MEAVVETVVDKMNVHYGLESSQFVDTHLLGCQTAVSEVININFVEKSSILIHIPDNHNSHMDMGRDNLHIPEDRMVLTKINKIVNDEKNIILKCLTGKYVFGNYIYFLAYFALFRTAKLIISSF